jgi:hypothetical protein
MKEDDKGGHVARMGDRRMCSKVSVEKPKQKRQF